MRLGIALFLGGLIASVVWWAVVGFVGPSDLWNFDGLVAYLGRAFLAGAVLGVFIMAAAALFRVSATCGKIRRHFE